MKQVQNEKNTKFNNGLKKLALWIITALSTLLLLVILSVILLLKIDVLSIAELPIYQASENDETKKLNALRQEHEALLNSTEYANLIDAKEKAVLASTQKLEKEEKKRAELKEREALQIEEKAASTLAKLTAEHDQVEQITWYQDSSSPIYVNETGVYLSIGMKEGGIPVLDMHLQYEYDSTWLFVDSFTISADEDNYEINPGYSAVHRDNSAYSLWEWYVYRANDNIDHLMLATMANADSTIVRFHGKDYYHDIKLSQQQKSAMKNVLDAYFAQVEKYEYKILN